ncbi:hypothetical protein GJ744_000282 [Endocarpon pusillum]|uniref:Protein kinase domain-containing protein n=1 Tax=Endocarpon pusillum TaxID=364733 RepID=A0A8H7ANX3_9EURO|nr:hypothetical protein GJ744_000282 [Endocarpon pusillum]
MDPVSAAGIGLSVSSLVLQVFVGCVKGYQLFVEADGMPAAYQHFRTRLQIEQTRLLTWGEKVGLVEELLDYPSQILQFNRNLILDILLEIQASFKSCIEVTSKYEVHVRSRELPTGSTVNKVKTSFLERTLARLESPAKVSARLQWAMIKQDHFEKLIGQLVSYNDRIEGLLDRHALEDLRHMQQKSNLMLLQLTAQVSQLQILAGALQLSGNPEFDVRPGLSSSSTLVGSADTDQTLLASHAAFKALQLSAEIGADVARKMLISREDLNIDSALMSGSRILTTFYDKPVWVEWRDSICDPRTPSELGLIIQDRVAKLAALLSLSTKPPAFRAPKCIGYFRDDEYEKEPRYGLICETPNSSLTTLTTMFSLRDLFSSIPSPSLNKRIALACTLSESLLYLHAVNWLHKGIRSDSILFFPLSKSDPADNPFLLTPLLSGFDFSRPDLPEELTFRNPSNIQHDMYRHPSLLQHYSGSGTRSQKSHDIYSLRVVLTEIALWSPIETIAKIPVGNKAARSRVLGIREILLTSVIENLICERVAA